MSWIRFGKVIPIGRHLRVNLSRSGVSFTGKVGRASMNSRQRRLRVKLPFGLSWKSPRL